jgi:hypothetical protein
MEPQSVTQLLEQRILVLVQRHTELLELVTELSSVTDELDTIRLMLGISYANDQVSTPVVEEVVITPTEEVNSTPYVAQRMIPRPTGRFRY